MKKAMLVLSAIVFSIVACKKENFTLYPHPVQLSVSVEHDLNSYIAWVYVDSIQKFYGIIDRTTTGTVVDSVMTGKHVVQIYAIMAGGDHLTISQLRLPDMDMDFSYPRDTSVVLNFDSLSIESNATISLHSFFRAQ